MFLNLLCLFGRMLVLAIIHTPGISKLVSYEFKESYHNNTEKRTTQMQKDFGLEPTEFIKYSDSPESKK